MALQQAGEAARGATLYVTLEPCCHHGKTPPCTDAILAAGLARVVAAIRDPFPKVDGGGLAALRAAGVAVELGLRAAAAAELNAPYLKRLSTGLPYVTAKWAMTLDGKTAAGVGRQPVDLVRSVSRAWSTSSGDAWTRSSWASARSWPTIPCSPPGPQARERPSGSCSTARRRFPAPAGSPQTARDVPVLVAVTEAAPARAARRARRARLRGRSCFPGQPLVAIDPLLRGTGASRHDQPPGRRRRSACSARSSTAVMSTRLTSTSPRSWKEEIIAFTPARGRGVGSDERGPAAQ